MIRIEESSGIPIYLQVVSGIRREILTGVFGADDRLPSIRDLAMELKVNPNTIAKAYQELEQQGSIYFKRGQGAFVAPKNKEERMQEAVAEIDKLIKEILEISRQLGISSQEVQSRLAEHMKQVS
jgi:GntR family transcriptional regulator